MPEAHRVGFALDDARPGDQNDGTAAADGQRADLDGVHGMRSYPMDPRGFEPVVGRDGTRPRQAADPAAAVVATPACFRAWLAATKLANRGCGRSGLDLNSGWNCTAMYQGWPGSSTISTNFPSGERPEMSRPFSASARSYRQLNSYR